MMAESNEYPDTANPLQSKRTLSILTGFLVGLAIPITFILYVLIRTWIDNAQHPLVAGEGRCGTGAAMMIIVALFTTPFFGAFGAIAGWQIARETDEPRTSPVDPTKRI